MYAGYNVIAIDPEYKYALVAGKDMEHLWILSRERAMPEGRVDSYLELAESYGYDTSKLVWVGHDEYEFVVEEIVLEF